MTRESLHRLIDELPEADVPTAARVLEALHATAEAALASPPVSLAARQDVVEKAAGETLTARELDIVRLVGKGLGNKAIAHELGVSVATIRTHLNRVYEKLAPGSRVELALYAAQSHETVM